ncbi:MULTISPECIES: HNH endonuclease [Paenibacillus]|uniref:HNH endonuclease n=1 Tax=Paenibacillus TaxID=44249 RepID=UPI001C4EDE93|nr:HNH endonuclease [Paenibacillus amylolyticus]
MRKIAFEVKPNENGCLIITSNKANGDGYVYVYRNRKHRRAHRLVYEECFGEIPEGLVVRHKCDVRNCVNPEHLELGTQADNVQDRVIRGRSSAGEHNGRKKHNEKTVREIRRLVSEGMTTKGISARLDVNFHTVKNIRERKTWKHII